MGNVLASSTEKDADISYLFLQIIGRKGVNLQDYWKGNGGPQTYRSCMLAQFPNFFYGMGTNSGTGHFSYIFTAEVR